MPKLTNVHDISSNNVNYHLTKNQITKNSQRPNITNLASHNLEMKTM
jgi:hypothetical protein